MNTQHAPHIPTKQQSYQRQRTQWPLDWNVTPMAPLGNRAAAFITQDNRNTFAPHAIEAYVTVMAPYHYWLLEMYIPTTRGYRLTRTYSPFPSHWSVPIVSEHTSSVVAATDLLQSLQQVVPTTAKNKRQYITTIRKLTSGIENYPTQETQGAPRVGNTPTTTLEPWQSPRVDGGTIPGHHLIDPETIRTPLRTHQRRTRQNVPMPVIMEVAVPPAEDPTQRLHTQIHTGSSREPLQRAPQPKSTIPSGNGSNSREQAKDRKKLNAIIVARQKNDRGNNLRKKMDPPSILDALHQNITYHCPSPKGHTQNPPTPLSHKQEQRKKRE